MYDYERAVRLLVARWTAEKRPICTKHSIVTIKTFMMVGKIRNNLHISVYSHSVFVTKHPPAFPGVQLLLGPDPRDSKKLARYKRVVHRVFSRRHYIYV